MQKLIDWLHENKIANLIILCSYFLLVVLPHEIVGRFIMNDLLAGKSRPEVNSIVLIFSLVIFSFFLFVFIRNFVQGDQKKIKLIYLIITLGLIVLVYNTLFVLATESAHFPQYAVLAILLFPLTLNYNSTLFWSMLLGAIDEAYQYFYLNPTATGYFDFNDVITDLLGAVLGLLFLWSFQIKSKPINTPWYRRCTFLTGIGLIGLGVVLNFLGIISLYATSNGNSNVLTLMNKVPESFWSYDKVGNLYFHIVHPLEGILLIIILLGIYTYLGKDDILKNN